MKVTGFTFIRNAILYDYPVVESIRSILPICDDFVVAVGQSEDATHDLIREIDPVKIRIIQTQWNDELREGGRVLAQETDKAFRAISAETDWAFYLQADEVVHEKYLPVIRAAMLRCLHEPKVDGLLFNYLHFYGSYDYVGDSARWYRREIRVVRKNRSVYSYRDAQGFRKGDDQKLNVYPVEAYIYHYGWVKDPRAMQEKQENFNRYWHDDAWVASNVISAETFDYERHVSRLRKFEGTHPEVMRRRISRRNWRFDYEISRNRRTLKERAKALLRQLGVETEYQNYRIVDIDRR